MKMTNMRDNPELVPIEISEYNCHFSLGYPLVLARDDVNGFLRR